MTIAFRFNPERIAYAEAHGWRAYYNRDWLKLLRLIVVLCQEQFHIPFPVSVLAAYYSVRASIAWVPADHDEKEVCHYLEKFYHVAQRYCGLNFDPTHVATLELQYFTVHRRLSGQEDKSEFVQTIIDLHSALFDLSSAQVRKSAEMRVMAANVVDTITSKRSTDPERDWVKIEECLRRCYASLERELKG